MDEQDLVVMGYVQGAFGVRGWISIHPDTTALDGLLAFPIWYLAKKGGVWHSYTLLEAKTHNLSLIASLASVNNRDTALGLKGFSIAVPRCQLPKTHGDEYYWVDLIKNSVVNEAGESLGCINTILRTPAHDILVVKAGKVERLIPFVSAFIKAIELSQRRVVVAWPKNES